MIRSALQFTGLSLSMGMISFVALACSQSEPLKPVFPARGQVFFDGKPAAGALVVLHPINDPVPNALDPRSVVANDGTFIITTHNAHDGAPPGKYVLTIHRLVPESEAGSKPLSLDSLRLPLRYASQQSSGLEVEIYPGNNTIPPFRLTR